MELIDTGADVLVCHRRLLDEHAVISPTARSVRGLGGQRLSVLGSATLSCIIASTTYSISCYVVFDDDSITLILGMDFLHR